MDKINVTRAFLPELDEYVEEIKSIWNSHWITNMGEKHCELQKEIKSRFNIDNVELFTNGHMALELSLQSLGLTGEVITTPFTFISTTHAITRNNLKPVFCDINEDDYTIDTSKIERLITKNTSAIMPVHVYGNVCDVKSIDDIAQKYGLKVIYDAAHAFAEEYEGESVANFGDISCFSFHATKVFNTIEGGAACFRDVEIGKTLYHLKNFGIEDEETISGVGANAKMNEFCAAMGICNLRHLDEVITKRKMVYERYLEQLECIKGIKLNFYSDAIKPNYAYFPVYFDSDVCRVGRDDIYKALVDNNIIPRKYFYPATNACRCYEELFNPDDTPVAKKISKSILTLPMYADLDVQVVDKICEIICSMVK